MARVRDLWRDSAGGKTGRDGRGKRWLAETVPELQVVDRCRCGESERLR
jgi:hypothetical protein